MHSAIAIYALAPYSVTSVVALVFHIAFNPVSAPSIAATMMTMNSPTIICSLMSSFSVC